MIGLWVIFFVKFIYDWTSTFFDLSLISDFEDDCELADSEEDEDLLEL